MDFFQFMTTLALIFSFFQARSPVEYNNMAMAITRGNAGTIQSISIPVQTPLPSDLTNIFGSAEQNTNLQDAKLLIFGKTSESFILKSNDKSILVGDFSGFSSNDLINKLQEQNIQKITSIFLLNEKVDITTYKELLKTVPVEKILISNKNPNIRYELGAIQKPAHTTIETMSNNLNVSMDNISIKFIPNKELTQFSSVYLNINNRKILIMKDYNYQSKEFNNYQNIDLLILLTPFGQTETINKLQPKKVIFAYPTPSNVDKNILKNITKELYQTHASVGNITIFGTDVVESIKIESIPKIP